MRCEPRAHFWSGHQSRWSEQLITGAVVVGVLLVAMVGELFRHHFDRPGCQCLRFIVTIAGIAHLRFFVSGSSTAWAFAPGLPAA
jgi:hypothetical protein